MRVRLIKKIDRKYIGKSFIGYCNPWYDVRYHWLVNLLDAPQQVGARNTTILSNRRYSVFSKSSANNNENSKRHRQEEKATKYGRLVFAIVPSERKGTKPADETKERGAVHCAVNLEPRPVYAKRVY